MNEIKQPQQQLQSNIATASKQHNYTTEHQHNRNTEQHNRNTEIHNRSPTQQIYYGNTQQSNTTEIHNRAPTQQKFGNTQQKYSTEQYKIHNRAVHNRATPSPWHDQDRNRNVQLRLSLVYTLVR
jgi:hypothetical protein